MNCRCKNSKQGGFTLIEVVVAATLVLFGLFAGAAAIGSTKKSNRVAERKEVAVHQAQRELEKMRGTPYAALGLPGSANVANGVTGPPNETVTTPIAGVVETRVKGFPAAPSTASLFNTGLGGWEFLQYLPNGTVAPGPTQFEVGGDGDPVATPNDSGTRGRVWRYVTLHSDAGAWQKRLSVAVELDPANGSPTPKPVWMSTIVAPTRLEAPVVAAGNPVQSQVFYLYDTPCSAASPTVATSHAASDTAAKGPAGDLSLWSTCSPSATRHPDLMGASRPPGTANDAIQPIAANNLSALAGYGASEYPGGLATQASLATCPTTYDSSGADTNQTRNTIHRWSTAPFTSSFRLTGTVTANLFTHTVDHWNGIKGAVCFTLIKRSEPAGQLPTDTVVGKDTCGPQGWPEEPFNVMSLSAMQVPCNLFISPTTIAKDERLVLALSTPSGTSQKQLIHFYGDPDTPTSLRVTTSTPCTATGDPCQK